MKITLNLLILSLVSLMLGCPGKSKNDKNTEAVMTLATIVPLPAGCYYDLVSTPSSSQITGSVCFEAMKPLLEHGDEAKKCVDNTALMTGYTKNSNFTECKNTKSAYEGKNWVGYCELKSLRFYATSQFCLQGGVWHNI